MTDESYFSEDEPEELDRISAMYAAPDPGGGGGGGSGLPGDCGTPIQHPSTDCG